MMTRYEVARAGLWTSPLTMVKDRDLIDDVNSSQLGEAQ